MNKKNKIFFIGILILLASVLLVTPLFAKPKTAKPWDESSRDDDDFLKTLGLYDTVSKSDIATFLDDYADFANIDPNRVAPNEELDALRQQQQEKQKRIPNIQKKFCLLLHHEQIKTL